MYEKLLISAGGGIIDRRQQSEQGDNAVLYIGLGGTGIDALRNMKRKVYNRVKPEDPDSPVAEYPHIKFLAVDTDMQDMCAKAKAAVGGADGDLGVIDPRKEFFDISYSQSVSELFSRTKKDLGGSPVYREWLQFQKIKAAAADTGAGGIRQLGRFLFLQKARDFVERVQRLVLEARTSSSGTTLDIQVHVFAGISGGTGAGTFLDACYLVREALKNETFMLMGYFFLPDMNLSKPNLPREAKAYIRENGYASLQELDYCMNLESNGDSWHQAYDGLGVIQSRKRPVDLCHLVSSEKDGNPIPNAYECALNVVTDYAMDYLVRATDPKNFGLKSHLSNIQSILGKVHKDSGACYDYVVLGAASTMVPFKQVLTYLASEVFAGFGDASGRVPNSSESEAFQKKAGFAFDPLLRDLLRDVDLSLPFPACKPADARDNEKLVIDWFHDMEARAEGVLARNYAALSTEPKGYGPVATANAGMDAGSSLAARALAELRDAMADPARGPFYAAALLRGLEGSDLVAVLRGVREEAKSRRDHERFQQTDHLNRDYEQAQRDFRGSNFLNMRKKYEAWVDAVRNLVLSQIQEKSYQKLMDLMDAELAQLNAMADNFTDPFAATINDLFAVFRANHDQLEAFADRENPYEMPLISMKQLMPSLKATVESMDVPGQERAIVELLLNEDGLRGWGPNGDESLLCKQIIDYFVQRFDKYSSRTLTDYLEDRYGTKDPVQLADSIKNDLLASVSGKAAPLFDTSVGYTIADASPFCCITVPTNAPAVVMAANSMKSASLSVRETAIKDRISVLRFYAGIPMFGYKSLQGYERDAVTADYQPGTHLYEPAEVVIDDWTGDPIPGHPIKDSRDWTRLPSPVPPKKMDSVTQPVVREGVEPVKQMLDDALKTPAIEKRSTVYAVRTLSDAFMQDFRAEFDAAKDKQNDVKLEAKEALKGKRKNLVFDPKGEVLSNKLDHDPNVERAYLLDALYKAPVIQEVLRREVAKYREMDADIEALEPKKDPDFDEFSKALFTGVIVLAIPEVKYVDPEFGEEINLSKPQMPYGGVPLYQALKNFKELDGETRTTIRESVQKILEADLADRTVAACRALHGELKRKRDLVTMANAMFPHETGDVKSLITALEEALKLFSMMYGFTLE